MTPTHLANLYGRLRQRVAIHVSGACTEVSVMLPSELGDELAFYRLVNWSYVLINEAARIPVDFLIRLPPLNADGSFRREIGFLRTFVSHNLDLTKKHDLKTIGFTTLWFKNACGFGSPRDPQHFAAACSVLASKVAQMLQGALDACDALDDPVDGQRLVDDLKHRIETNWDAFRFDPLVAECAKRLGDPGLDLLLLRSKHLDSWRKALAAADVDKRERVLVLQIEAALLAAIGDTLPLTAKEASERLRTQGRTATTAALLMLRDARRFGKVALPELIEIVCSAVLLTPESSAGE